jgi:hypothetical protein
VEQMLRSCEEILEESPLEIFDNRDDTEEEDAGVGLVEIDFETKDAENHFENKKKKGIIKTTKKIKESKESGKSNAAERERY